MIRMSKQVKLICPVIESSSSKSAITFDWERCILCQENTSETLQCPANIRRSDVEVGAGYRSLEAVLLRCRSINWFPTPIRLDQLNDENGIASKLQLMKAKWHKTCRNKYTEMKLQRHENSKRKVESEIPETSRKITRQSPGCSASTMTHDCFFCGGTSGELHKVATFSIDSNVRKYALQVQDTVLLAKLSAGDMISQEAMYHKKCYSNLFNKARPQKPEDENGENQVHGIVLAELVSYVEESRTNNGVSAVFRLADLITMYTDRLEQFGLHMNQRPNSTHIKDRILAAIPDLQAHKQGRDVLLMFNEDVGNAIQQAITNNYDDDALILAKAAKIVRKEMMQTKYSFNGFFETDCQKSSVPQSLKSLVGMILGGPSIETQSSNFVEAQCTLTIAQLLQFNSSVRRRKDSAVHPSHATDREPPLPTYLGLLIHAETRKRGLVDKLYGLGLSICYDRIMQLSGALGNSICDSFNTEDVVCPAKLRKNLFTTAAIDNIDHNPSSTTAQGSLHGTAISVFQHPESEGDGIERWIPPIEALSARHETLKPLPESYTVVPPVVLPRERSEIPPIGGSLITDGMTIPNALNEEYRWLEHVQENIAADNHEDMEYTWSAFHANRLQDVPETVLDISSLLPLFQEEAKSVAMIRHALDIIKKNVDFLNPGQTPVITCDQPLFALAKLIQWTWPERFSEKHVVILFGGLHIEIAAFRTIGDWLDNSGWTSVLCQADIASPGTADSFLKSSHVKRTRHAHEVTACSLYILMKRSYERYIGEQEPGNDHLLFEEWREQREIESPLFNFWSLTMRFEIAILVFIRSLREGNFQLYKDSISLLIPWFFALDHPNYARWLPVHLRDMITLQDNAPEVEKEFQNGNFVAKKSHSRFSSIALDQAHEQNNKLVKGDGGAIGLTENMTQLQRWMVSGPEIARVINEFESAQEQIKKDQSKGPDVRHHEQVKSRQNTFAKHVTAFCSAVEDMGNPFLEQSEDLLILDTRDIVDKKVAETVRTIEIIGRQQFHQFVRERLESNSKSIYEPIKQNKLLLFSRQQPRTESKEKQQIVSLKQNCSLFSQLYVSCQVRNGDLIEFFKHENQAYPPSLSQFGDLRHGSKSDLLTQLEKITESSSEAPTVDALVIDGAALINMLKPRGSKTFEDYFRDIVVPYVRIQLHSVRRVDIVWDEYFADSLKSSERSRRGKGIRRRVLPDSRVPGNWEGFLRVDENKKELFAYLSQQLVSDETLFGATKQIITTKGSSVNCLKTRDTSQLEPCTHEEADTRMLLHVKDAVVEGHERVMIRTVDTDVVVIAISCFRKIEQLKEFWIAFGAGKNFRYLSVHNIASALGPQKSHGLLFFHAFTGCDQVSSFANKGKKRAWDTWTSYIPSTETFDTLSDMSLSPTDVVDHMDEVQRFVVLMYDKTSECITVNGARMDLFARKGRTIDNIPPTEAALLQHTKRACYMASQVWDRCLEPTSPTVDPAIWGWKRNETNMWIPFWTILPEASVSCNELIKCGCKSQIGCRGRCKCVKANLTCTALCKCGGECDRD